MADGTPAESGRLLDEFEVAWAAGESPRIEDYLERVEEAHLSGLFADLLRFEIAQRRRDGQIPTAEEYRSRFPGSSDLERLLPELLEQADGFGNTVDMPVDAAEPASEVGPAEWRHHSFVPERIGRYRIERVLGHGGFGIVYLAHDDQLERRVAVKVPHVERVSRPEDVDAYLSEAHTLAALDHPGIVPVYDVGSTGDHPCYVVSKYVEGTDLAKRLKRGRFDHRRTAELVATVAEALQYAHQRGVVHRDVKPANILIDENDTPCIVDFGLAVRDEDFSRGPEYVGTPAYTSPEQARGEAHRVDGRSDVFSLGIVLYELLVGRRPFRGDNVTELLDLVVRHEPRPPRQYDDRIPRELERICHRALAKRATERYSTARDLADELRHFLAQEADGPAIAPPAAFSKDSPATSVDPSPTPVTAADSDRRPVSIVPKGLRSFDAHDADFFLELLPGPRDREGLPEILRFWRTRIEETDPDETFSVGLIYGPSGCGKTSLVKAGLLPRLSADVIPVYVEATPEVTETRLLHGLRKRCPDLDDRLGLKETLASLRRGQGLPAGRKVMIVLDQFEQWLHASREERDTELVRALRQCDGGRMQCVVMVRDDFWMAATRFMRDLEVRLVEAQNSVAVDLFPVHHAERVLAAFGRAFGVLPDTATEIDDEQEQFVKQAVSGLAEKGKVVCVRLALFAEMMKGRPWTPASLKKVGGTEGVGVTFLEETFSASTAPPEHRYHQKAARAALGSLLPASGGDIKGHMRSYAELLEASGYVDRPREFDDMLGLLDGEVRLITPTDPEGRDDDDSSTSPERPGDRFFQLTHDYLVPSLRDWLTRKQKETRKGRAELLLADRAAVWQARPENRQLPSLPQWVRIRWHTRPATWTDPQRTMMAWAARHHGLRWGTTLLLAVIVAVTAWQVADSMQRRNLLERTETAVAAASTARGVLVPRAIDDLGELPPEMVLTELRRQYEVADDERKLPLALALAGYGDVRADFLVAQVERASPDEFDNLATALGRARAEGVAALERAARDAEQQEQWRHGARLAMLALHLEAPALAFEACRTRSDPIRRTLFIEECANWHGDLSTAAATFADLEDGNVRAAMCLAIGSASTRDVTPAARRAWEPVLVDWYQNAEDGVTHSACDWAMRRWELKIPNIAASSLPEAGKKWFVNGVGMTLLEIPAGEFEMGEDYDPVEVTLANPFWLGWTEVTQEQFEGVMGTAPWRGIKRDVEGVNHPATYVNWDDATAFCRKLTGRERRAGHLPAGWSYRLPTEAEWEYACRAGTRTTFGYGNDESLLDRYAVYNASHTAPCGTKFPNGWGLYDVHGNAREWCSDWWDLEIPRGHRRGGRDPQGPSTGVSRVDRGGSWLYAAKYCRSADYNGGDPAWRDDTVGFRLALSPSVR